MRITEEDVERVAALAKLELTEDSQLQIARELSGVLRIIDALDEVDTSSMDQMVSPSGLTNVFREDIALPSADPEEALSGAPDRDGAFFKVPRILEAD